MADEVLSDRRLNRALLARQGLLERRAAAPLEEIERVAGLQAQEPIDPYVGLWARLDGFAPEQLGALLAERAAVRVHVIRPTIHLVSAADCLAWQPLAAGVIAAAFRNPYGRRFEQAGVDPRAVAAAGRELLLEAPRTRAQLAAALAERWPRPDAEALGSAVTSFNPVVQIPPRGLWRRSGQATWALTEDWLGRAPDPEGDLDAAVLRYLAAFGPATPADMRTWSRLTGLREAFERLRPRLRTFRDERGRELFDVPDGPLPDPDTPAPPRLLPQFDNVLLAHDDRSRVLHPAGPTPDQGAFRGTVLVDGRLRGFWRAETDADTATIHLERYAPLPDDPPDTADALHAEAERLLDLLAPEATRRDVRI